MSKFMRNALCIAVLGLCAEAESETSTAGGDAPKPDAAATKAEADAAALEKKRTEVRNSHWCVHPGHGIGQIGEIGAQVRFHRYRMHSGDTAPSLDSEPVLCELADLRLCTPDELPEHLGYTPEQLHDLGYV